MSIKNHVHQWVRLSCQVTSGKPPSLPFQETDWELPVLCVWLVTDSKGGWDLGKKKHDLKSCAVSFSQRRFLGFSSHWDPLQDEDICLGVSIYHRVRQCLHLTCVTYKNCTRHWKTLQEWGSPKVPMSRASERPDKCHRLRLWSDFKLITATDSSTWNRKNIKPVKLHVASFVHLRFVTCLFSNF